MKKRAHLPESNQEQDTACLLTGKRSEESSRKDAEVVVKYFVQLLYVPPGFEQQWHLSSRSS
jgi:hypothetical protein